MVSFSFLRAMQDSDLSWVLSVEQRAYDFPWSPKGFENSLDQGLNYIFCSDSAQNLGYACLLTVADEAHLLNFCIDPDHQGCGVGRRALEKLKERLKAGGYGAVLLEVRASNRAARKLYQQCGFKEDGCRKGYYRSQVKDEASGELIHQKEDAVLMSCLL